MLLIDRFSPFLYGTVPARAVQTKTVVFFIYLYHLPPVQCFLFFPAPKNKIKITKSQLLND